MDMISILNWWHAVACFGFLSFNTRHLLVNTQAVLDFNATTWLACKCFERLRFGRPRKYCNGELMYKMFGGQEDYYFAAESRRTLHVHHKPRSTLCIAANPADCRAGIPTVQRYVSFICPNMCFHRRPLRQHPLTGYANPPPPGSGARQYGHTRQRSRQTHQGERHP